MKKLMAAMLGLSLVFAAGAATRAVADDAKDTTKKEKGIQPMDKTKRTKHHHRKKTTEGTATPDARKTTEQQ